MRKLLVLSLVLGMASLASAVPVLTVSDANPTVGDTFYLYVTGTAADASQNMSPAGGGYASMITLDYANYASSANANPYISMNVVPTSVETAAGGSVANGSTYGNANFTAGPAAGDWAEGTDVDAGLWFTYELTADAEGLTQIGLTADWGSAEIGAISVNVVPEPMTMALLGLGGLFLRRRK